MRITVQRLAIGYIVGTALLGLAATAVFGQSAQLQFATDVANCADGRVLVGLQNGPMAEVSGWTIVYPANLVAGAKAVSCGRDYVAAVTTDDRLVIVDRQYRTTVVQPAETGASVTLRDTAVGDNRIAVTGLVMKAGSPTVNKVWFVDPETGVIATSRTSAIAGAVAFDRGSFWWADNGKISSDFNSPIITQGNPHAISARNLVVVGTARPILNSILQSTLHDGLEATLSPAQCAYVDSTGYEFACARGRLLEAWVHETKRASIELPADPKGVAYDGIHALVALYAGGVARYRLEGGTLVAAGYLPVGDSTTPTVARTATRPPPTSTKPPSTATQRPLTPTATPSAGECWACEGSAAEGDFRCQRRD